MKNFVLFFLLSFFIEGVFGESVSVTNGDSVTLHTGLTEMQKDDVLEWRFGVGLDRIARVRKDRDPTTYDDVLGGRFRDRLKLDGQTGDLTITNITTEHDGPYEISINTKTFRTFSVIVVPDVDAVKSVSLIVGDSVTLNSGTNIQRDDVIEWRFGDLNSLIAGNFSTSDGPDERFRDRLQLDYWTGSLTIMNIGTDHAGVYESGIRKSSSGHTIHKSYNVTASGEMQSALSVMEGDSVTLQADLTDIKRDDVMQWMFGDTVIVKINKAQNLFLKSDVPDERYRGRLHLDPQTGSLTITETTLTDSGLYELKIISSRFIINKRIIVTVTDPGLSPGAKAAICVAVVLLACAAGAAAVFYYRRKISKLKEQAWRDKRRIRSVMEGETITLNPDEVDEEEYINPNPDDTDVHKDGGLQWMFRGSCIAEQKRDADSFTVYDDLKGRLELDPQTGSLTITDTINADSGQYQLLITRSGKSSIKRFRVSVFPKSIETDIKSVKEGESVTLKTDVTVDIQEDGLTHWLLGYTPLVIITGGTKTISPFAHQIFQGRLKLDHQTVSLTIKKIRPTDAGIYMLYKIGTANYTNKLFKVEVLDSTDNINKPKEESVTRNNTEESVPLRSVHTDSRL